MVLEEAIEAPRVLYGGRHPDSHPLVEVVDPITDTDVDTLEAMGYEAIERYHHPPVSRRTVLFGGVNAVGWDADSMTFVGVGDGRRWGSAQGARVVAEKPLHADVPAAAVEQ